MLTSLLLCTVVGVSDGDTLDARCEGEAGMLRVRLAQVDAPERRQPWGERSRQALAALCFDRPAQLSQLGKDRYGRVVASVSCAGQDAGQEQVRAGLAWAYTRYTPALELVQLEAQARAGRRGLWADPAPVAPWQWRAEARH